MKAVQMHHKNIQLKGFTAQSYPEPLEQIGNLIDQGKGKPSSAEVLPLAHAAEAKEKNKEGHVKGKTVL